MATKFKFVDDLPQGVSPTSQKEEKVFTQELVDALDANPGKWLLVPEATPQGATAWQKRINGKDGDGKAITKPYVYRSVNTGKTYTTKAGGERVKPDVYVSYQPE